MQSRLIIIALISSMALGGCIFAPGNSESWDHDHDTPEPTLGQELLDLDKAHQAGIITTAEYERTKDRLLNGR